MRNIKKLRLLRNSTKSMRIRKRFFLRSKKLINLLSKIKHRASKSNYLNQRQNKNRHQQMNLYQHLTRNYTHLRKI